MGFDNMPTLSGLFYIISTKDEKCGYLETVLSWNHFWGNALQQPSFTPFTYNTNNVFEYLESFDGNDLTFNNHCKNNNMDLKLWEKKENSFKELFNVPIKLHPFFDTFSNPKVASQFHKEKMPVVSSTDWIDVNIGSAVKPILSARIQVALAIGTPEQLDTFKGSRNITIPPCTTTSKTDNPTTKKTNPTALADMLNTFIDNLALSLPKRTECDPQYPTDPRYQLRRTSDLLESLQNALRKPLPVTLITTSSVPMSKLYARGTTLPTNYDQSVKNMRVTVNIDSARILAVKENKQGDVACGTKNEKPCTYVSFEAIDCEDEEQYLTFATKMAQSSCNPYWNEKFNVMLPVDLMRRGNDKKFLLKMWRKLSSHQNSHGSKHVNQDEVIGVTAIDLRPLATEPATISGHFNIIDSAGQISGHLKINIALTDENDCQETADAELPNTLKDLENGSYNNVDNAILSRTLKRKFTELEEISQRLKSRLLDVTADDSFDVDDEFENDLNTCPNEDDMDVGNGFDWDRFSTLEIDCGGSEPHSGTGTGDRTDFSSNALDPSAPTTVSNVDSNSLPVDGNPSMNVQSNE